MNKYRVNGTQRLQRLPGFVKSPAISPIPPCVSVAVSVPLCEALPQAFLILTPIPRHLPFFLAPQATDVALGVLLDSALRPALAPESEFREF